MSQQRTYDFAAVQKKWNEKWETMSLGASVDFSKKKKMYAVVELPYPSAAGLHMGHCWNYAMFDIYSRFYRLNGYNVLYPMGWDSFGLPTYNHAVKVGRDPHEVSAENVATFKRQLKELGLAFDWNREVDTSSPEYYKWTQWIFIQMYEHWYDASFKRKDGGIGQARPIGDLPIPETVQSAGKLAIKEYQDKYRIAFKAKMPVAWCPKCKTGLANEEVTPQNTHERCDTPVEQRELEQWMLRITAYAERLIADLDTVDFPNGVKAAQVNWIGKKTGINITYDVVTDDGTVIDTVTCFTTRPDTNYGATFVAIAPEHPKLEGLRKYMSDEVNGQITEYKKVTASKSKEEREAEGKKKTGVYTTLYCVNQLTGRKMPLCVSDFVLMDFGTGTVVGVPGHDLRDYDFAIAMGLPILRVVASLNGDISDITSRDQVQEEEGTMINSGILDGMNVKDATEKIITYMEEKGYGKRIVFYKFHDWVFSRQHYWGEPTPMVHCKECGWNPVKQHELPIKLPKLDDYKMGEDGSSPLEKAEEWKKASCPSCGSEAVRETDVMPNWAGSNWYYLRYLDPHNKEKLVDYNIASYWMPLDIYYGGQEHVTLHLLYSRFVYKFLYDLGTVPQSEPYAVRRNHGIILGPDNRKMSKSWGNVVNPDEVVGKYGADAVRMYLMFIGPYDTVSPWSEKSITGVSRFVQKVYSVLSRALEMVNGSLEGPVNGEVKGVHQLAKKLSGDIAALKFNTGVAAFMEFLNINEKARWTESDVRDFLILISIYTPYLGEEMWERAGFSGSVHQQKWPVFEGASELKIVEIPVMVNGKVRARMTVSIDDAQDKVVGVALSVTEVQKHLPNGHKKVIYVPGKAVNFVG